MKQIIFIFMAILLATGMASGCAVGDYPRHRFLRMYDSGMDKRTDRSGSKRKHQDNIRSERTSRPVLKNNFSLQQRKNRKFYPDDTGRGNLISNKQN